MIVAAGAVALLVATACEVPPPPDVAAKLCAPWESPLDRIVRSANKAKLPLPEIYRVVSKRMVTIRIVDFGFVVSVHDPAAFTAETGVTNGPQLEIVAARADYTELASIAFAINAEITDASGNPRWGTARPSDSERAMAVVSDGFVQVGLLPGMEGFAQQLRDRYGVKVSINVGAWQSGGGPEVHPGTCLVSAPEGLADSGSRRGVDVRLQLLPAPDAAFSIGATVQVINRSGSLVEVGSLEGFLVRRGSDQVVAGFGVAQRGLAPAGPASVGGWYYPPELGMPQSVTIAYPGRSLVPSGESTYGTIAIGTANKTAVAQAALPPGRYEAIAVAEIDGKRYRSQRVPVTLGAPHPFG